MQQSMVIVQKRMPELQQKLKKITEELTGEIKAEMERSRRKDKTKNLRRQQELNPYVQPIAEKAGFG